MGTRGAVGVCVDGKIFATYRQFDCYPSGLGRDVVEFCKSLSEEDLAMLAERFKHVVLVDQFDDKPSPEDQERYVEAGFYDGNVSNQTPEDWYCLLRQLQGVEYLEAILDGTCQHWIDSSEFLKDSLFCEFAYIIDLDKGDLWFFEGFNKSPDEKSPLPFPQVPDKEDGEYYPVRFKGKVAVDKIPDNWMKLFYPEEAAV